MSYRSSGSGSRGDPSPRRPSTRRSGSSDAFGLPAWDDEDDDGRDNSRRGEERPERDAPPRGGSASGTDYSNRGYASSSGARSERSGLRDNWQAERGWDGGSAGSRWGGQRNGRADRELARRSSKPLVITLAVLLTVIVAAVIGVLVLPGKMNKPSVTIPDSPFATYAPGPTATVTAHFKAFGSDRSKYSLTYPEVWNTTSDDRTTQGQYDYIDTFALQDAPSRLLVEQAGAFSAYTDAQIMQNEVSNAQHNGVTFTKADTPAPAQKVGGATWTRQDYSVNANGNPVHMALLACHHGGRGYVIVLVSSAGEFSNDDQAVFEPMLSSFLFL